MKKFLAHALAIFAFAAVAHAADTQPSADPQQIETLRAAIKKARPNISISSVKASGIPGLLEVELGNKDTVYMSTDGAYLLNGTLYRVETGRFVNVADERMKPMRAAKLAAVKKSDMIIFSPAGETKSYVTVFTDIDCGFCRKLHKEIPELNAMGIEVRYLAFPRAGVPSPSADKLATAWCSENPRETLTQLKNGSALPVKTCDKNPVAAEYKLGNELGVNGTPALFKPDGDLLPGYMPAKELAAALGVSVNKTAQ